MFSDHVRTNRGVLNSEDHIGYVDGRFEPYEDFDYTTIERNLGELPPEPDPDADAAELADLLRWIWSQPGNLRIARQRFRALAREAASDPGTNRAAVAFEKLIRWCTSDGRRATRDTSFRQFCAVSATVSPALVAAKTYVDLARELGVTKAAVSAAARNFREDFHFFFHEYRPAAGRAHMRQARLAQRLPGAERAMNRNHGKRPGSHPGP